MSYCDYIEQFLDSVHSTNFSIIARGDDAAMKPTITIESRAYGKVVQTHPDGSMLPGQQRQFALATSFAQGGNLLAALNVFLAPEVYFPQIETYFFQIELKPLSDLEPLLLTRDLSSGQVLVQGDGSEISFSHEVVLKIDHGLWERLVSEVKRRQTSADQVIQEVLASSLRAV